MDTVIYRTIEATADALLNGQFVGRLEVFTETRADSYLDTVYVSVCSPSRTAAVLEAERMRRRLGLQGAGESETRAEHDVHARST